jgi:septum site-determining protein MinC
MATQPTAPHFGQDEPGNQTSAGASVSIKGTRKGLFITLGDGDWHGLLQELDRRMAQAEVFFQGSQVNMTTGDRDISQLQLHELMHILEGHQIELARLHTGSRATAQVAQALGVRLGLPEPFYGQPNLPVPTDDWTEGLLFRRTLRSGQALEQPGHVVIIGDVHAGAKIVAGGDIVVWGRLRGMVHAGALGNEQAVVCALELKPSQLRIGSVIATSPDEQESTNIGPEVASVIDGQIVARPWTSK